MAFQVVPVVLIVATVAVVMAVLRTVSEHLTARRQFPGDSMQQAEILRRLERIEQTVESTAIEIERVAESNRFVAKLLAERPQPLPKESL